MAEWEALLDEDETYSGVGTVVPDDAVLVSDNKDVCGVVEAVLEDMEKEALDVEVGDGEEVVPDEKVGVAGTDDDTVDVIVADRADSDVVLGDEEAEEVEGVAFDGGNVVAVVLVVVDFEETEAVGAFAVDDVESAVSDNEDVAVVVVVLDDTDPQRLPYDEETEVGMPDDEEVQVLVPAVVVVVSDDWEEVEALVVMVSDDKVEELVVSDAGPAE
ncbi:hypothetical protein HDU88_005291 [Geranomyces variabilis]|nr:hypothetical protein HDU88_005291 [Geranomyces variabilis]